MALNSFMKCCPNVLTIKPNDYGQDFHFYHETKCKEVDKTLWQFFLSEGIEGHMQKCPVKLS